MAFGTCFCNPDICSKLRNPCPIASDGPFAAVTNIVRPASAAGERGDPAHEIFVPIAPEISRRLVHIGTLILSQLLKHMELRHNSPEPLVVLLKGPVQKEELPT